MKTYRHMMLVTLLVLALGMLGSAVVAQSEPVVVTWWTEDYIDLDQINETLVAPIQRRSPGHPTGHHAPGRAE